MFRSSLIAILSASLLATPALGDEPRPAPQIITAEDDARRYKCRSRQAEPRTYLETSRTVAKPRQEQASVQRKGKNGCGVMPIAAGLGVLAVVALVGGSSTADNTQ